MDIFTKHISTWLITSFISLLTIFSDKLLERIRFSLNRANARIKYYEELAKDLSSYIFYAEIYLERFERNEDDDPEDLGNIADAINSSMTKLRTYEYVYKSWISKYWRE